MRHLHRFLMILFIVIAALFPALLFQGQDAWAQESQSDLLAMRSAELDAYGKLIKQIKGFQYEGLTLVSKFLTEADLQAVDSSAFVKGAKILGHERIGENLWQCTAQITLRQVVENFESIKRIFNKGAPETEVNINTNTRDIILRAVGFGTGEEAPPPEPAVASKSSNYGDKLKEELKKVEGKFPPQSILLAIRAAETDAYGKLAKEIKGFQYEGTTVVSKFLTEADLQVTQNEAFVKGARLVDVSVNESGIAFVTAAITLRQMVENIDWVRKNFGRSLDDSFYTKIRKSRNIVVTAVGHGAPEGNEQSNYGTTGGIIGEIR